MGKKLKVKMVSAAEGKLYERYGEDEKLVVFDTGIMVEGIDGKYYTHNTFNVPGAHQSPDGWWCVNRSWRSEVEAFVAKVRARGVIDLDYWTEYIEETWAEREAYNLRCEEDEMMWEQGMV